jgi:hypothetical protein
MSDRIRSLLKQLSPAQSSGFDREGFQRSVHDMAQREPEAPAHDSDYEAMRYQHRMHELAPSGGQHYMYHPTGQRGVMPSMMREHLKKHGDHYMNEERAAD